MSQLKKEILLKSQGSAVKNHKGEPIGKIVKIIRDDTGGKIEYLILESNNFFGSENRFFAIPNCASLIKLTDDNKIFIQAERNDLLLAKIIATDKCPKLNLEFGPSIFELSRHSNLVKKTSKGYSTAS